MRKSGICLLAMLMLLLCACGTQPIPQPTPSDSPPQEDIYVPFVSGYSIFPLFLTDGNALLCAQPNAEKTGVELYRIQSDFSYGYNGVRYETWHYYAQEGILYFFAGLHARSGLVFGDLYSLSHGAKRLLQTDVRMDSVRFSANKAGLLYIACGDQNDHTLYLMEKEEAMRIAEQVYQADYLNYYEQVFFLRDPRGTAEIEETIRMCEEDALQNRFYEYELFLYTPNGKIEQYGLCGEVLCTNPRDSELVVLYGVQKTEKFALTRARAEIGVIYTLEKQEYRLKNVLMESGREQQGVFFMTAQENGLFSLKRVDRSGISELCKDLIHGENVSRELTVFACEPGAESAGSGTIIFAGERRAVLDSTAEFPISQMICVNYAEGFSLYGIGSYRGESGLYLIYSMREGAVVMEKIAEVPQWATAGGDQALCYSVADSYGSACSIYAVGYSSQSRIASGTYLSQDGDAEPAVRFYVGNRPKEGLAVLYFVRMQPGSNHYTLCTSQGGRPVEDIDPAGKLVYSADLTEIACNVRRDGGTRVALYVNGNLSVMENSLLRILD